MKPNLFHFATSELSQDAIICWLLSWAKPEFRTSGSKLHEVGVSLLKLIHSKANHPMPELTNLVVRRQVSNIDILCVINDESAVIIEDKVGSKQHSNQLGRYRDHVMNQLGFPPEKIISVYLQTGDQSDYKEVEDQNYSLVSRTDLLSVLESDVAQAAWQESDILECFSLHLRNLENDVQSYLNLPLPDWTWNSWKGFYSWVQTALGGGNWDYVSNASGGFLGFWWYSSGDDVCEVYLQMEQERFCFKIVPPRDCDRYGLGNEWSSLFIEHCHGQNLRAVRPSRIRRGDYMTVAVLGEDFRKLKGDGLIDLPGTLEVLRAAERVIDETIRSKELNVAVGAI